MKKKLARPSTKSVSNNSCSSSIIDQAEPANNSECSLDLADAHYSLYSSARSTNADVSSISNYHPIMNDELPSLVPEHQHRHGRQGDCQARLVTFYRNGDAFCRGLAVPVTQRQFPSLETLLVHLNSKIGTPTGIRHLLRVPGGAEVRDIAELRAGDACVVSSVRRLMGGGLHQQHGGTGTPLQHWRNKPLSAGKLRRGDLYLWSSGAGGQLEDVNAIGVNSKMSQLSLRSLPSPERPLQSRQKLQPKKKPQHGRQRNITIISNSHDQSSVSIQISRRPVQKFEDLLYELTEYLQLSQPPVQTLYTEEAGDKKHRRVCSYSQLFTEFKDVSRFIACGKEFYPSSSRHTSCEESGAETTQILTADTSSSRSMQTIGTQTEQAIVIQPLKSTKKLENEQNNKEDRQKNFPVFLTIRGKERAVYPTKSKSLTSKKQKSASNKHLRINWIYGFNSSIGGRCVEVINSNEILYCVSKVAVIYNIGHFKQRYFLEHTASISCMAVHPNKRYIATGQSRYQPTKDYVRQADHTSLTSSLIYIWDATDCSVLYLLDNGLGCTVDCLDFSTESNGKHLLVLEDRMEAASMSVWAWEAQIRRRLCSTRCHCRGQSVSGAAFHPDDASTIVTWGSQHLCVWRVFWPASGTNGATASASQQQAREEVRILRDKKSGLFDFCIPDRVTCLAVDLIGNLLTGDSNGTVHLWARNEEDAYLNRTPPLLHHAHAETVSALLVIGDGTVVSAAGHTLRSWDSFADFRFVKERHISTAHGRIVRLVASHPERIDGKLWLATDLGCLLEGGLQDNFSVIVQGFAVANMTTLQQPPTGSSISRSPRPPTSSVVPLTTAPTDHSFICASPAGTLMRWSLLQQRPLWSCTLDVPCSVLQYYGRGEGNFVLLGTTNGKVVVVKSKSGAHVMSFQVDTSQSAVSCISFSPDHKSMLVGCVNCDLKMFGVSDGGAFYRPLETQMDFKGTFNVQRIDWTKSGKHIRTEDVEYCVKLWSLNTGVREIGVADSVTMELETERCLATFKNMEIWQLPSTDELTAIVRYRNDESNAVYGTQSGLISMHSLNSGDKIDRIESNAELISIGTGPVRFIETAFDDSFILSSAEEIGHPCVVQWSIVSDS